MSLPDLSDMEMDHQHTQQNSTFLWLPGEIRNRIYKLATVKDGHNPTIWSLSLQSADPVLKMTLC